LSGEFSVAGSALEPTLDHEYPANGWVRKTPNTGRPGTMMPRYAAKWRLG